MSPASSILAHSLCRMITAALPAGVVYLFLWFVPPVFDESASYYKFIYYLLFYFAFQALLTVSVYTCILSSSIVCGLPYPVYLQCIHVPYTALTMHLSHDNKERDSATLYRKLFT